MGTPRLDLGEEKGLSGEGLETWTPPAPPRMSPCPHVPEQKSALTWVCCSASQKMATEPRWPSRDVGVPHSVSWLPAAVVATTPSVGGCRGVQAWGPRAAGKDCERQRAGCGGKASSGPWDGGGWLLPMAVVVVRCPAEPMQQEVKDCRGKGEAFSPQGATQSGVRCRGGVPDLVQGGEAELRRLPQVPVRVDADHVLAEGPAAGHVDDLSLIHI